jgi:hypothetical protein
MTLTGVSWQDLALNDVVILGSEKLLAGWDFAFNMRALSPGTVLDESFPVNQHPASLPDQGLLP